MNSGAVASACKSVFKGGKDAPTPEQYTQIWTALINQMERSRQVLAGSA